jgi:hypothetical protein
VGLEGRLIFDVSRVWRQEVEVGLVMTLVNSQGRDSHRIPFVVFAVHLFPFVFHPLSD